MAAAGKLKAWPNWWPSIWVYNIIKLVACRRCIQGRSCTKNNHPYHPGFVLALIIILFGAGFVLPCIIILLGVGWRVRNNPSNWRNGGRNRKGWKGTRYQNRLPRTLWLGCKGTQYGRQEGRVQCNRLHLHPVPKAKLMVTSSLTPSPLFPPICTPRALHHSCLPWWGGSTPSSPPSGGSGFARIPGVETGGECTSSTRMFSPARTRMCRSCGLSSSTHTATQLSWSSSSESYEAMAFYSGYVCVFSPFWWLAILYHRHLFGTKEFYRILQEFLQLGFSRTQEKYPAFPNGTRVMSSSWIWVWGWAHCTYIHA